MRRFNGHPYIMLLRAINVGGGGAVKMRPLRQDSLVRGD
jgi:uncharacterized protein (DUF1697 family)